MNENVAGKRPFDTLKKNRALKWTKSHLGRDLLRFSLQELIPILQLLLVSYYDLLFDLKSKNTFILKETE